MNVRARSGQRDMGEGGGKVSRVGVVEFRVEFFFFFCSSVFFVFVISGVVVFICFFLCVFLFVVEGSILSVFFL